MATATRGRRAERQRHQEEVRLQLLADNFKDVFDQHEGGIPLHQVLDETLTLRDSQGRKLPPDVQRRIVDHADKNRDGRLNYEEFKHLMIVERPDLKATTKFQKSVMTAVSAVVPSGARNHEGEYVIESYTEKYNCCPPPLFIVIISAVELIVFIAYIIVRKNQEDPVIPASKLADAPRDSPLIYQPARRYEAWRFLTYMFIHHQYAHIISNLVFQLLLGIPLEMVHKFWRVGIVYCLGVIFGSLATSVTDPWTLLCGASGGCYALIGAHFAKIIMNWKEMTHEWLSGPLKFIVSAPVQLVFFFLYMTADTSYAIYARFFSEEESRTAFVAHFAGFIGGMLVGIPVLKNFYVIKWETVVQWVALAIFIVLVLFGVCFNIFYTAHYPATDWRSCCPLPCMFYPNCDV